MREALVRELRLTPDDATFEWAHTRALNIVAIYRANCRSDTTPAQVRDDLWRIAAGEPASHRESTHRLADWLLRNGDASTFDEAFALIDRGDRVARRRGAELARQHKRLRAGALDDWALAQAIGQIANLYTSATRRPASFSRVDDEAGGPLVRFIRACLPSSTPEAIAHRLRQFRRSS